MIAALAAAAAIGSADIVFTFAPKKDVGEMRVALFDNEASFKAFKNGRYSKGAVKAGHAEVVFRGLPPGTYAAMIFHDLNGDGDLNRKFGIPQEPYAASNNAKGFPLPGWGAAKFEAGPGETKQAIRID